MDREEDLDLDDEKVALANAHFGIISESVRRNIPEANLCAMFCGGRNCKYESPVRWKKELQAIEGLYSAWVTKNILAMSRPNTELIKTYNIIEKFKSSKIKAVVNLQTPGEHSSCGPPLESSGFSYDPQDFMRERVSFYNFAWKDYGFGSMSNIIDIVRVMQFAISEGKVAVHCHAGLVHTNQKRFQCERPREKKAATHIRHAPNPGRTGVLIACYLIYSNRLDANKAILYVRSKRPGAIQTQSQMKCVQDFATFLQPLRIVFSSIVSDQHDFTLSQFLTRQKSLLHGYDARRLKHIPKIIAVCCEVILDLAERSCKEKEAHHVRLLVAPKRLLLPKLLLSKVDSSESINILTNHESTETIMESIDLTSVQHSISLESFTPIRPIVQFGTSDRRNAIISLNSHEMRDSSGGSRQTTPSPVNIPESHSSQNLAYSVTQVEESKTGSKSSLRERVAMVMGKTEYSFGERQKIQNFKEELNESTGVWSSLRKEKDVAVLSGLMWDWMDHLQEPILRAQDLPIMLKYTSDPLKGMAELERGTNATIALLFFVIACLRPMSKQTEMVLVQRVISTLTHQTMVLERDTDEEPVDPLVMQRTSNNYGVMRSNVAKKVFAFFMKLLDLNEHSLCQCLT